MNKKLQILYYYLRSKWLNRTNTFSTRQALMNWQQKQFSNFKTRILTNSEFYKSYVNKPLEAFPIVNKATYMNHFDQINTLAIKKEQALNIAIESESSRDFSPKLGNVTVGLSSGTSGSRGLFLASEKEQNLWAGTILSKVLPKSLWKKQKVAFFLRANSNLYEAVNSRTITFKFFDLLDPIEKHIADLNDYQPDLLVAPASMLNALAQSIKQLKPAQRLNIKPIKIVSVAEVLLAEDKQYLEDVFQQKIHQVYQATEGCIAATCREGNLHLNEDLAIIEKEWIDKASGRFSPIITDFRRHSQPIVRYKLDDVLILEKEPCACGSQFTRIKAIEGRCDDVLLFPLKPASNQCKTELNKTDLVKVFPDFIRNTILSADADVENYKVVQASLSELVIALKPLNEQIKSNITKGLKKLFERLETQMPVSTFIDYSPPKAGDKLRRVIRSFDSEIFSRG